MTPPPPQISDRPNKTKVACCKISTSDVPLHRRFHFRKTFCIFECLDLDWSDKFYLKHIHLGESCIDEQILLGKCVLYKLSQLECCVDVKKQ